MKQLLIFLTVLLVACGQKPINNADIIGKWQLIGNHCDDKGRNCSQPSHVETMEFSHDGVMKTKFAEEIDGKYYESEYNNWKYMIHNGQIIVTTHKGRMLVKHIILLSKIDLILQIKTNEDIFIDHYLKVQ